MPRLEMHVNDSKISANKKNKNIGEPPRGKTAGYYGAETKTARNADFKNTKTIMLPLARPRGIAS
ncbi:hypothetical protein SAMN06297164_3361 [Nitrosomonas ureae]|uniref:Uncharacterized protein n=1 Tax=Nitrosomonas ureae TaxID=44577 RepID=A0A286AJT9_9PROT|nr:hypothetical protein SAMN06297164_3361 [Nitrosomonas ureae]